MKHKHRDAARRLRFKGWSVRTIAERLSCSKSSISLWVRDIALTSQQIANLKSSQDRGRAKAANHPNSPKHKWARARQKICHQAQQDFKKFSYKDHLKVLGAALYWAEGYKVSNNLVVFVNSDPDMIKLMMDFFRKVCKVPEGKFRGRVNIHPSLSVNEAQQYWASVSKISLRQFHKPLLAVSRSSQQKRKTLPLGTFRIIISDVIICSRLKGWINGLKSWAC